MTRGHPQPTPARPPAAADVSGSTSAVGRRHIRALDGVRGAAVAAVLLFHAGHLTGGWLGVDLFFVLSGFLITALLLEERATRRSISLPGFWSRRARRLLPALFLVLGGVAVYALVWAAPGDLARIRADGLATLGYVANWHQIARGHPYWDLFHAASPLQHTWSLAIEEQFYLVWPLVVVGVLAWRRSVRAVLVVALLGAASSFLTMVALYRPGADPQRVYLGTDTRASSILLGAALAALVASGGWAARRAPRLVVEVVGLLGVGTLAWAWASLSGTSPAVYEGLLLACSAAGVAVVAAAAHPRRGVVAGALSWRPLCLLGVISYGVYLWHWPVYLVLDGPRTGLSTWPLTGLRVAVTLAIATVSYRLVEAPIRRGAGAGWRIRLVTPIAAAVVLAVVVVATVPRATAVANPQAALRRLAPDAIAAADARAAAPPFRLLVTGDSISARLVPAFRALQSSAGYTLSDRSHVACSLQRGATGARFRDGSVLATPDCSTGWAEDVARDRPDVVFVSLGGQVLGDWQIDGQWLHPCDAAYDRWFQAQLVQDLALLTAGGTRVALALPAPALTPDFFRRTGCIHAIEARVARLVPGVSAVDFERLVCPAGRCLNMVDGVLLREDGFHYTGAGAELVVRWLAPQLQALAAARLGPARPARPGGGLGTLTGP